MTLEKCNNIASYIPSLYKEDEKFLESFPDTYYTIEDCINKTVSEINESINCDYYLLNDGNDLVGYFCYQPVGPGHLAGFFIRPKYRKKEYLTQFWKIVSDTIRLPFYASMVKKNSRAMKFYERNGGKVIDNFKYGNEDALLFLFK